MAPTPDDEAEDDESAEVEQDWGNQNKAPSDHRLQMVIAAYFLCAAIFMVWLLLGLCAGMFGAKIYIPFIHSGESALIWIMAIILTVTILAALYMPLDDE